MSTQAVQAALPRASRAGKAVAKTADFKGALAQAQAPFTPVAQAARPAPRVQLAVAQAAMSLPRAEAEPRGAARAGDAVFRGRIAAQESAGAGWAARNASSGALGRYQMLPVALRDIGWQGADGSWAGGASRFGIASEADFLANPAAQEAAMSQYLQRTERQLAANGALNAAGSTVTATDGQPLAITEAGLVAAAHRRGAGAVARWLDHRTRTPDAPVPEASRAAFASVEQRLRDFAGVAYATGERRVSPSA